MSAVLRRFGHRLASTWELLQVELHGKYSVERLFNLRLYSKSTSNGHALAILFLTPLPCLLAVIGTELIPLEAPEKGLSHSATFWVRVFLTTWMMNFTVLEQCRYLVPRLPMFAWQNALVSLFSGGGGTCIALGLAHMVGYPLPFLTALGSPGVCVLLLSAATFTWGKHFRGNPTLQTEVKNYVFVACAQLTMTYVYPAYNFAFVSLSSSSQTAFVMLLPVMKLLAKNVMSYLFSATEDFKPEMVIFNVEVFHALFVSFCMQNATSINTTLLLIAAGFVQATVSLYDVDGVLKDIHKVIIDTHLAVSHATQPSGDQGLEYQLKDKRKLARDWATLDMVVKIVQSDRTLQDESTEFRFQSQTNSASLYEVGDRGSASMYANSKVRIQSRRSITPNERSTKSSTQTKVAIAPARMSVSHDTGATWPPPPLLPQQQNPQQQQQEQQQPPDSRTVSFALLFTKLELLTPTVEEQQFIATMSVASKVLYVRKMLQLLHLTEYLLLIKFTEVMIPVVYCVYLMVVFYLPNRAFYSQLSSIDDARLVKKTTNVLIYAALEVLLFFYMSGMVHRKVKISSVHQLAFVMSSQKQFVQSKLILWVVFSVQTALQHFGVDYSFKFAWLYAAASHPTG
ncbi:hypothetical protein Gpo141_00000842 [Globisporangium polare]